MIKSALVCAKSSHMPGRHFDHWDNCAPLMPIAETVMPRPGRSILMKPICQGMLLLRVIGKEALVRSSCQPFCVAGISRPLTVRVCSDQTGLPKMEICCISILPSAALKVTLPPSARASIPPKEKSLCDLRLLMVFQPLPL